VIDPTDTIFWDNSRDKEFENPGMDQYRSAQIVAGFLMHPQKKVADFTEHPRVLANKHDCRGIVEIEGRYTRDRLLKAGLHASFDL
jgi:hypothetical protein